MFKRVKIRSWERGLYFRDQEFRGLLEPSVHWFVDPAGKVRVEVVSVRDPWLLHDQLDVIVKTGVLKDRAQVIDLCDHERALVWVDGRFEAVLGPGLYALWTLFREVRVEVQDAREVRFAHPDLSVILEADGVEAWLERVRVPEGSTCLVFVEGRLLHRLGPGQHALWRGAVTADRFVIDQRETMLDVAGQEIITADKVSLRLNAAVTYRVEDPQRAVTRVRDFGQALYREAQLVLRAVIGTRELDSLLAEREAVAAELHGQLRARAEGLGVEVLGLGIRDVILPGEMRELLNKVTEARKAAEAAVITRREETSAMRSMANTAKLLEQNPTLMRLKELETLERIAEKTQLSVLLGDKGLSEQVFKLL